MKLSNLAANLRKYGLTVVEVDGWQNRGYAGQDLQDVRGVVWHHTATPRSNYSRSDAPTLGLCVNGRSDLPGPLCQIVFGRTGIVYVIAAGVGNHAGVGSAWNVPANTGNHYMIGIEMESSGIAPYDWTADQIRVAPYLGAALELSYLMDDAEQIQVAHKEYSSEGKIDPAGWPGDMDGLRSQINAAIAELTGGGAAPAPAAPAPVVPNPVDAAKYVPDPHWLVEKGETLSQIAKWAKYSVDAVAEFNGIGNPDVINVGEWIWSPAAGYSTWMVDPGDTLSGIVQWYANNGHTVTVKQLQYANGINDPSTEVKVGMRLLVP